MLKIAVLCALAALAYGSPRKQVIGHQDRIVGGQEAEPHAYPWQVSLQYRDFIIMPWYHTCGATIVDEYHIVCAAHCVDGRSANNFRVIAGAHNIGAFAFESGHQNRKVSELWRHENYDHNVITNDVSVLRLDEPLVFDDIVKPMKLAEPGYEPAEGTVCINSGWGSVSDTQFPEMPNKLQYVELPIIGREACQSNYDGINGVTDGMICAGSDAGGISPCSGDSGGPLVCPDLNGEWYLAGVVSWGMIPCGQAHYPGVFANVAHFRDWLDAHIAM